MESSTRATLAACGPHETTLVVGAPGSGKTTLLIHRMVDLVNAGLSADHVVMLTPSRAQASQLRDQVSLLLNRTTQGPRVRSMASFAFAVVQSAHQERGLAQPDLLSASQVDSDIEELLEGHRIDGLGPIWPEPLGELVRGTTAFRQELREWMARATENGIDNETIEALAATHSRPEWAAAAEFRREYDQVLASSRPATFDSAQILRRARLIVMEGLPQRFSTLQHIVVDDAMDLTTAGLDLVRALRTAGIGFTIACEPDVAGNTFRGSEPAGVQKLATDWGLTPLVLPEVYRHGPEFRDIISQVAWRIGTAGMGTQRKAQAQESLSSRLYALEAQSEQREATDIARLVATAHQVDKVPLHRIAVIARRGQRVNSLVRELGRAGIAARGSVTGSPLRDQPAAKELLEIVALGRGLAPLTPQAAVSVLSGRYGHMAQQDMRRLRFRLRVDADSQAPYQPVDLMIAQGLAHRGGFALVESSVAKRASLMAEILDDVRQAPPTMPVNEMLWMVLARTGVLETWRRQSEQPGPRQAGAHRALDSLVALFHQAAEYTESHPLGSLEIFLSSILDAEVPDDVVLPEPAWPAVTVATPPGVAGKEFDYVVIAGVEEGVWPDLRLRGSLLSAHRLISAARGEGFDTLDERKIVRDDELRLFVLALSRATTTLVVCATQSEHSQPSPLFRLVQARAEPLESKSDPAPSLRATTGRLRGELVSAVATGGAVDSLASDLAVLASWDAPGADPQSWWGVVQPSSTAPLYHETDVSVSPSGIEALEESPVEWFLGMIARAESTPERGLGSLIHQALEENPAGDSETLWQAVDKRFSQLEYEAGWIEDYQRRVARGMVDALGDYLADRKKENATLLASEHRFRITHGRAVITGVIDRIEHEATGAVLVVDLKTGNHSTDSQVVDNAQMLTYQLALETTDMMETLGVPQAPLAGACLLFVKSGVRGKRYRVAMQEPLDSDTTAALLERIDKAVEIIAQAQFTGEPRSFGPIGTPSRHRWHFIGQVCGDV
jgi:superfamily I DNA/RNA helicase/RecB family exonuclease